MAVFEKKQGAPSGSVTIQTAQGKYTFTDGATVTVTDPNDIATFNAHPMLQVSGTAGGTYVAPAAISDVFLKDGVLTSAADGLALSYSGVQPIRTVGLIGASTEANNGTSDPIGLTSYYKDSAGLPGLSDYGYLGWTLAYLGWRAPRFTLQGGVSGNTSADILARVPDLLSDRSALPDVLVCGSGLFGNDFSGGQGTGGHSVPSLAAGQANIKAILDQVVATGKLVVIATAQHHSGAALAGLVPTDGLTYQQYQSQQNAFLRRYAEQNPRCLVLDIERITSDAVAGGWRAGLSGDGLHPYTPGAALIGSELAALLAPFCSTDRGPANALDPYNLLGTKGFMQGTGGVGLAGITASAIPAGWTVAKASLLDARAPAGTIDLVPRVDGLGNELKVTVTSPGALTVSTSLPANTFGASDYYSAGIEARFGSDLSGVHGVGVYCTTGFAGKSVGQHFVNTSHWSIDKTAGRTIDPALLNGRTVAFRTQRRSLDTNEATDAFFLQTYFWVEAGTIYLSRGVVRKNA